MPEATASYCAPRIASVEGAGIGSTSGAYTGGCTLAVMRSNSNTSPPSAPAPAPAAPETTLSSDISLVCTDTHALTTVHGCGIIAAMECGVQPALANFTTDVKAVTTCNHTVATFISHTMASHPFLPESLDLPHYVPNALSMTYLLAVFFGVVLAVVVVSGVAVRTSLLAAAATTAALPAPASPCGVWAHREVQDQGQQCWVVPVVRVLWAHPLHIGRLLRVQQPDHRWHEHVPCRTVYVCEFARA